MKSGDLSESHVKSFCSEVCANGTPTVIACEPQYDSPENECFELVEEKVENSGGKQVLGWAVWEKLGVFIEAEFHSVWQRSDGSFLDLNPRPPEFQIDHILFVPDESLVYEGKQVDNIRKPLVKDRDVVRFLFLSKKRFQIMNRGNRAYEYGEISLPPKELKEFQKVMKELIKLQKSINNRYGAVNA